MSTRLHRRVRPRSLRQRREMSLAVKSVFKPKRITVPPAIETFAEILDEHGCVLLSAYPELERQAPRNTWCLAGVDPDPIAITDRWERCCSRCGLRLLA